MLEPVSYNKYISPGFGEVFIDKKALSFIVFVL
jgi:hypothetical protein